ncbi:MAG: cell division protein FtsL [Spirochaetaceae bacterium]|jgi:cell division protein FtsL|nr:cell division protein FtsL [Spirochaetaceae bacterium]
MLKKTLLYAMAFTIPLTLGITAWQSTRFAMLRQEIEQNNRLQTELVEQNQRLITEIAALSASSRIDKLARDRLGLDTKRPEDIVHITIHQ